MLCNAVPCPVFCGAVSCCAVLSLEHTAVPGIMRSTRYHVPVLYVRVYSSFCSHLIILSRISPCFFPANYTLTADQNVTSTSTQYNAGQLALHKRLLALSIRYSHQIIIGLFFPPRLHVSFAFFLARAGGVSRPRSGALCFP